MAVPHTDVAESLYIVYIFYNMVLKVPRTLSDKSAQMLWNVCNFNILNY